MRRPTLGQRLLADASGGRLAPGSAGGEAWAAFLLTHAAITRVLDAELRSDAGLSLADFDVLMQLGLADGSLRMTELARRSLVSRSGMTRRVAQLEERGLVRRGGGEDDRRAVRASLRPAGVTALERAVATHARGIGEHFLDRLDSRQLNALRESLEALRGARG